MIICPIISLLGAIFFALKYFIDKYNLIVVYPKNHSGSVDITWNIHRLGQFNILLVELLIFTFFSTVLNATSDATAVIGSIIVFQVGAYLITKFTNVEKW